MSSKVTHFKVLDDEKMQETVESVREHGVLMPGIARPRAGGRYVIMQDTGRRHGRVSLSRT